MRSMLRYALIAAILCTQGAPSTLAQESPGGGSVDDLWRLVREQQQEIRRLRDRLSVVEEKKAARAPVGEHPALPASAKPVAAVEKPSDLAARLGFLAGAASGQVGTGWGPAGAAFLDLTLLREEPLLGQRLSGEIFIGYHESSERLDVVTSALFGADRDVMLKSSTLTLSAAFKYTVEDLSDLFKPYLVFGPAYYVEGIESRNGRIAGQVFVSPELGDRAVPDSWFEPEVGIHMGVGFHLDVSERFFLGVDGRYNAVGDKNNDFGTLSAELGFRF